MNSDKVIKDENAWLYNYDNLYFEKLSIQISFNNYNGIKTLVIFIL